MCHIKTTLTVQQLRHAVDIARQQLHFQAQTIKIKETLHNEISALSMQNPPETLIQHKKRIKITVANNTSHTNSGTMDTIQPNPPAPWMVPPTTWPQDAQAASSDDFHSQATPKDDFSAPNNSGSRTNNTWTRNTEMTVVSLAVLDLLARLKTFSELIAKHGVIFCVSL